jgi:hypothetical protein
VGESGRIGQERREPLHPPVDGDVVYVDTAFDQQFLNVTVGEVEAQIPPYGQHDDVRRVPEPSKRKHRRRPRVRADFTDQVSLDLANAQRNGALDTLQTMLGIAIEIAAFKSGVATIRHSWSGPRELVAAAGAPQPRKREGLVFVKLSNGFWAH